MLVYTDPPADMEELAATHDNWSSGTHALAMGFRSVVRQEFLLHDC
jgi:hypothetical protein